MPRPVLWGSRAPLCTGSGKLAINPADVLAALVACMRIPVHSSFLEPFFFFLLFVFVLFAVRPLDDPPPTTIQAPAVARRSAGSAPTAERPPDRTRGEA